LTSNVLGAASTETDFPLTFIWTCMRNSSG
jgi:hypothetical protein